MGSFHALLVFVFAALPVLTFGSNTGAVTPSGDYALAKAIERHEHQAPKGLMRRAQGVAVTSVRSADEALAPIRSSDPTQQDAADTSWRNADMQSIFAPTEFSDAVAAYESMSHSQRKALDDIFAVESIRPAQRKGRFLLSTSLFWKTDTEDTAKLAKEKGLSANLEGFVAPGVRMPELSDSSRTLTLSELAPLGPHTRNASLFTSGYLAQLQKLIHEVKAKKDWNVRVHLARDLHYLAEHLDPEVVEVHMMKHSSLGLNPGMLWRFIGVNSTSYEAVCTHEIDKDGVTWPTVQGAVADLQKGKQCVARYSFGGEVLAGGPTTGMSNYDALRGGAWCTRPSKLTPALKSLEMWSKGFIAQRLAATKIGHCGISAQELCTPHNKPNAGCKKGPKPQWRGLYCHGWGSDWFAYAFDEYFLKHTVYWEAVRKCGLLSLVDSSFLRSLQEGGKPNSHPCPKGGCSVSRADYKVSSAAPNAWKVLVESALMERSPTQFDDIWDAWKNNQATRNAVKRWITRDVMDKSIFSYGIGYDFTTTKLVADTGPSPIQHDFISQLGARMERQGRKVRYMEIGVSVLKGIHTQLHFFRNATVTAFDIEDPNPTIEGLWQNKTVLRSWSTEDMLPHNMTDIRRSKGRVKDFVNSYKGPLGNSIYYVAGNTFNMATWRNLKDVVVAQSGPPNLILSDALHTGPSVLNEVVNLISNGIVQNQSGEDFSMIWDDCGKDILSTFRAHIVGKLHQVFQGRAVCFGDFVIPGWAGKNEHAHRTCVFSTQNLSGPHLGASATWVPEKNNVTCVK